MIQISSSVNRNLNKISEDYFDGIKNSLIKKISRISTAVWIKEFLIDNLYKIISGVPEELYLINKQFKQLCRNKSYNINLANSKLKYIFNYDWLADNKTRAYEFALKLQVNTCPYCNRNYTVTVLEKKNGKKIIRPDFDHFFPKARYPLLALSFYNLIPSCPLCNRSVKGSSEIIYGKYIHPYEESFGTALKINYSALDTDSMIGIKKNLKIKVLLSSTDKIKAQKCHNNFKLFKLKEIYETSHLDEIADIIRKHHISGGRYLEKLHSQFKGLGTLEDLYKIAFSNYYNEDNFANRPLAKLTKDVFDQLSFVIPRIK